MAYLSKKDKQKLDLQVKQLVKQYKVKISTKLGTDKKPYSQVIS